MGFIFHCDAILRVLDELLIRRGIHHSDLSTEELAKMLHIEINIVLDAIRYLETWEFVSTNKDSDGNIYAVSITHAGTQALRKSIHFPDEYRPQ